jgi:hypothetical protein
MIELVVGLAVGFGAGFSLMAYRLMVVERELTDDMAALIEKIKEVRP